MDFNYFIRHFMMSFFLTISSLSFVILSFVTLSFVPCVSSCTFHRRSSYQVPEWVYSDVFSHNLPSLYHDTLSYEDHDKKYLPSDYVKGVNGMNEAFIDAFNDVYYEEIRAKLEKAKTSEAIPRKKSVPSFDDYSIPSWVYKKVFKHNKPRKFKEKNYVFWDRVIR